MHQEYLSSSIRELLFLVKRYWKLLVCFGAVFLCLGFAVSKYCITPKYKASVELVVTASPTSQTAALTYDQLNTAQQLLNTCAIVLKSDSVLDEVAQNLKLPETADRLANCVDIRGINETEVLDITVTYSNAQTAADIANAISKAAPDKLIKIVKASSVEVISSARADSRPISPNVPLYTIIACTLGMICSILVSYLVEILNDTFTTESSVEAYLEIPVLGVIPNLK